MNKLTLQINNLEALERLIGGDNEIEIEIRNSVVQKFAEKHLKAVANSDPVKATLKTIQSSIDAYMQQKVDAEVATIKRDCYNYVTEVKVNPAIKTELDRQLKSKMDTFVYEAVESAIKQWSNEEKINERIDKRVAYFTDEYIRSEVKQRIEKLKSAL